MPERIKVSKETVQSLARIAAKLQAQSGRRVDLDETIQYLVSLTQKENTRSDLLNKAFGTVPSLKIHDLHNEKRLDEKRTKRKYGL